MPIPLKIQPDQYGRKKRGQLYSKRLEKFRKHAGRINRQMKAEEKRIIDKKRNYIKRNINDYR